MAREREGREGRKAERRKEEQKREVMGITAVRKRHLCQTFHFTAVLL